MSHINKVIDADPHFVIDINTRNIKNVSQTKTSLVQYDHNSERFSFTLPRFIEGHDMMECNSVQVHYFSSANPDTKGVYAVTDLAICEEDTENVCCTWLISQNVTQTAGALQFMLRFACVAVDGTVEYAWHTNTFTGFSITAGMNNAEAVVEQYADILEQWKVELFSLTEEGVRNINTAKESAISDIHDSAHNLSNTLKGTASGEAVGLHDVSPIQHRMDVRVRSKNICPNDWESGFINITTGGNQSNVDYIRTKGHFTFDKNKIYYLSSSDIEDNVPVTWYFYDEKKTFISRLVSYRNRTIAISSANVVIPQNAVFYRLAIKTTNTNSKVQLGEGTTATTYTPYVAVSGISVQKYGEDLNTVIATYTPNADGTVEGVTSLYPSTTLLTDTDGVVIDCEYNRDINKAFEELTQAIVSLGGNV